MYIYPAIDLFEGKAVRLYKGDYSKMTVYGDDPAAIARDFVSLGATHVHIVDLEGARGGSTPNFDVIREIKHSCGLFCETGGGVRSLDTVEAYLSAGLDRVILGTAAVKDGELLAIAAREYGSRIAVGADIRDGLISVNGWTESSGIDAFEFCGRMCALGIGTLICTDISRDGAMQGPNVSLYRRLSRELPANIIASGGVSSIDDVRQLAAVNIHGAIIGKAYYTGAVNLKEAVEVAK